MLRDPADTTLFDLGETLRALADPTRRRILQRLLEGEAGVTEIARMFPISMNSVSKHIRLLERAHLVQRRIVSSKHLLSVRLPPLVEATRWMQAQCDLWQERADGRPDGRRPAASRRRGKRPPRRVRR